jgi:hypothetical protein
LLPGLEQHLGGKFEFSPIGSRVVSGELVSGFDPVLDNWLGFSYLSRGYHWQTLFLVLLH